MIADDIYRVSRRSPPFALYGAISRVAPSLHGAGLGIAQRDDFVVVRGDEPPRLPECVTVGGCRVALEYVGTLALQPSARLHATMVAIKTTRCDPSHPEFRARVQSEVGRQLVAIAPSATATLGDRWTVRVHGRSVVGCAVSVECAPTDAVAIQARGLGGKRSMGCGVFFPEVWTWH